MAPDSEASTADDGSTGRRVIPDRRDALKMIGGGTAALLAGCSTGDGNGTDPGGTDTPTGTTQGGTDRPFEGEEITYFTNQQDVVEHLEAAAAAFKEATGATVTIDNTGFGGVDRIIQLVQSGDAPEIYKDDKNTTGPLLSAGALEPMGSVMDAFIDQWGEPPDGARMTVDGEDYMLPYYANVQQQWYRGDIYENEPDTWADLLAEAEAADDPEGVRGAFVPMSPEDTQTCGRYELMGWAYANGARTITRQNGELAIIMDNSTHRQRWIETLEFLSDLHQYSPRATDATCQQMIQAIPSATAAQCTYPGVRPKATSIRQERDFAEAVSTTTFPYNGDRFGSSRPQNSVMAARTGPTLLSGGNTEVARAFLEFLIQPQYYIPFFTVTMVNNIPQVESVINHEMYQEELANLPGAWKQEDYEKYFDSIQYALSYADETQPANPHAGPLFIATVYPEMRYRVTIQGEDPGAVVDDSADQFREILADAQG